MTWSYYSQKQISVYKTIKINKADVIQPAWWDWGQPEARLYPWEPAFLCFSSPGRPTLCQLLSRHPKSDLNPSGDSLSQGNLEVWESIFPQMTAVEVYSHSQTDWFHGPQSTFFPCPVFLCSEYSAFRKWANYTWNLGFLGGTAVKNLPARDTRDMGSIPGWGGSPRGRNCNPLQYSCLENAIDWGAWWATVHGVTKSQTWLRTHTWNLSLSRIFIQSNP